jgi:hypothetical protein
VRGSAKVIRHVSPPDQVPVFVKRRMEDARISLEAGWDVKRYRPEPPAQPWLDPSRGIGITGNF